MPYMPTWNTPSWNTPYPSIQYQQVTPTAQYPMGYQQPAPTQPYGQSQAISSIRVDGPQEAMNRFLMHYPSNQLVPGFVSDPLFDVNGKQFHTLSIEADGHRNLETFDYKKHVVIPISATSPEDYIQRAEFDRLVAKVDSLTGGNDGVHGPVQAAAAADQGPDGRQ